MYLQKLGYLGGQFFKVLGRGLILDFQKLGHLGLQFFKFMGLGGRGISGAPSMGDDWILIPHGGVSMWLARV